MSDKKKEENTEVVSKPTRAAGAGLPGFTPRVPPPIPRPALEGEGEELPFIDGKDLLAGDPSEKKESLEEVVAKAAAAAVAAAMANVFTPENLAKMQGKEYTPPKPPREPINWKVVWEKTEWMVSIIFFLFLYWVSQYRTVFFYLTCVCIAIVFAVKIRERFFSNEKDDDEKDDDKDDEKDEKKKEEGGTNWLMWIGLVFGAVMIAVIGFVVAQHMGIFKTEQIKVVPVEKTTPAIIPPPETKKKAAEKPLDKFKCSDVPADIGLTCCDRLQEADRADCKDFVLKQMVSDGEGSH